MRIFTLRFVEIDLGVSLHLIESSMLLFFFLFDLCLLLLMIKGTVFFNVLFFQGENKIGNGV